MAKAASKSSANTELYIGTLKAAVGLFGTQAKPVKAEQFDTAGPSGGVLKFEMRGTPAPVAETEMDQPDAPVHSDPLATGEDTLGVTAAYEETKAAIMADDARELAKSPEQREEERARASAVADVVVDGLAAAGLVDGEFRRVLVEEGTGAIVEPEQVRRGVRLADGSFVDCTEQLAAIETRTKLDRIEIVKCIDSTQIRRERVIGSYYVGALDEEAAPRLRLLYEALRKRREVAIVKYTTRSLQRLGVIAPHARTGTLMLLSLIFAEDFREPPARARAIQKARVSERQVDAMGELLGALHGTVEDLDELRDDAIALREELKRRADAGEMADVIEPLPAAEEDVDLEGALVASLDAVKAGKV